MKKNIKIGALVQHQDSFPFLPEFDKGVVLSVDKVLDKCEVFWYINSTTSEEPITELKILSEQK